MTVLGSAVEGRDGGVGGEINSLRRLVCEERAREVELALVLEDVLRKEEKERRRRKR